MENDLDFSQYNQNFDCEASNEDDWLNLHINTLFLELQSIYTSTYIFEVVDNEWDRRVKEKDIPVYSEVRIILYESLVYRVILGLSKILNDHKDECSLLKATNQIEQKFRDNKEAQNVIKEVRSKLKSSQMVKIVQTYRDKFFAHLDRKSVLSYCRIDPTSAMKYVDCNEIEEWLSLINDLYRVCFGENLSCKSEMPTKEDIIYTFFWR